MTKPVARDAIYRRRRFQAEDIEQCVRWYITYRLSYRDLVAMMAERGVRVSHTTILRWVMRYVPEFEKRWARYERPTQLSWRMDETAVSVRGGRFYLYRALLYLRRQDPRWQSVVIRSRRYLNNIFEQTIARSNAAVPRCLGAGRIELRASRSLAWSWPIAFASSIS